MPADQSPTHEDLIAGEQIAEFEKLRALRVPASEGLVLLDLAPDVPAIPQDSIGASPRRGG